MCKCTPVMRTPWCGRPGCRKPETISIDPDKLVVRTGRSAELSAGGAEEYRCIMCDASGCGAVIHNAGCVHHPDYKPPIGLIAGEWDALWSWHNDRQYEAAGKEEYAEAQWHKERAEVIRPLTTFGKKEVATS